MSRNQPNILLLFTDQQRADAIGAIGDPKLRTPVLDRLVREGTTFSRAYTPSPVCVAARAALATGLPPHVNGCVDNDPLPRQPESFMEVLQRSGYQTHGVGKMHFRPDHTISWGFESRDISEELIEEKNDFISFLRETGFGHVHEPNGLRSEYYYIPQPSQLPARLHETSWVADRSIDFLKRRDRSRPFFLWSSFIKPHPPFENPTPWNHLYRCPDMKLPFRPENPAEFLSYWNRMQNRYKYKDAGRDDFLLRTMRAAYYACISFIDHNIGRILQELGDAMDETLILFSSDHGELLGDYDSFGKRCMLDPAARIPMIARWPGQFAAGETCSRPVSLLDLPTTFAAAAGFDSFQPHRETADLRAVVRTSERRTVFSQFQQREFGLYMATDGEGKYIYSAPDKKEWFFSLEENRPEASNLLNDAPRPPAADRLKRELIARFETDGYTEAVEKGEWRKYPRPELPADPDGGLLNQDPSSARTARSALRGYAD